MLKVIVKKLKALHRDEQGANMVEYVLTFAAIALPLVLVLAWFWKDITAWANGMWSDVKGGGTNAPPEAPAGG
jgi:Flp pilus assembly pilin Flp